MSNSRVCLTPGCEREFWARGLCHACYSAARLRVNSVSDVTWETLEAAGRALPARKGKFTAVENAAAFEAAKDIQDAIVQKDKELHDRYAAEISVLPKRVIDPVTSVADIRQAAEAVAANPSAENLAWLADVQSNCRQPAPLLDLPKPESQPDLENESPAVLLSPNNLPPLAPGMTWEDGPAGPQARVMTQEELIVAERKKAIANNRELRQRSLSAAKDGDQSEIDSGDPGETGMSDAEFERIRKAYLIRTKKIPRPAPPVVVPPLIQKPVPKFPEPELPSDVSYNQTLDGGGGTVDPKGGGPDDGVLEASELDPDIFVPKNPIIQE